MQPAGIFPASYQASYVEVFPGFVPDIEVVPVDWLVGRSVHVSASTSEGLEWTARVAGFDPSSSRALSGLYPTPDPEGLLIVQGGAAYLLPVSAPEEFKFIETDGHVTGVRQAIDAGLVLLATNWTVFGIDRTGLRWSTRRLAIEGVRMDEVDGFCLRGVADPDDDEPREFAVNLSTGASEGGAFHRGAGVE